MIESPGDPASEVDPAEAQRPRTFLSPPLFFRLLLFSLLTACLGACAGEERGPGGHPLTLSSYGLFDGDGSTQEPAPGVLPYDVNTSLFSDYTAKYRFLKLPPGTAARYSGTGAFDFPVGTVLVKTFAYPYDMRDLDKGRRLIETRLLIHETDGWIGLPYIWNVSQNEAYLDIVGGTVDVSWVHADGTVRKNNYLVPNTNQCKGCHRMEDKIMSPLGARARHLNRDFEYPHGAENQLTHWTRMGALTGAPAPHLAPRLPVWDDATTGTLNQRARAWLEVNCAHCHNPRGPARSSGLDLTYNQSNPARWGVYKPPVAAGRGSGDRLFDIVPGRPEASILMLRISSTDPGIMMPELGKRLVDEEGVELIRRWIAEMAHSPSTG